MGLFSKVKKAFKAEDKDELELEAARARHGIVLDAKDKVEMDKAMTEAERFAKDYDPWEDLRQYKATFFFGGWAAKKFHIVGQDKVKKQLEELAKKREEEAKKKDWDLWEKARKK